MNSSISTSDNSLLSKQLEPCYILRPLGFYLIFLWISGTILNGSILFVFIRYKQLRNSSTNIFIGGLILADFIGACFEIPLPAIAHLRCRWIFAYVGCVFEAIVAYFAGCSNMYILCLISIDRYFLISRSITTITITVKQAYVIVSCAFMLALFWTLMPLIGWSSYDYEGAGTSCSIKWEERSLNVTSYNLVILVLVYLIPVIIIIVTNINVFKIIRQRRRCTNMNLSEPLVQRQFLIERRITITVILIIAGFLLAWTPYAIVSFIRAFIDGQFFPPIFGTIPSIFAKTSVVWNPLIYVVRNRNFRFYLPFSRNHRFGQRKRISDPAHFSVYPYSAVRLPLPARAGSIEN